MIQFNLLFVSESEFFIRPMADKPNIVPNAYLFILLSKLSICGYDYNSIQNSEQK